MRSVPASSMKKGLASTGCWRACVLSVSLSCTLLCATALAQQTAPTAPSSPVSTPAATPSPEQKIRTTQPVTVSPPETPPASPTTPARRSPETAPQPTAPTPRVAPVARTPRAPAAAPVAPRPPAPPRQVITVVHRLSGWKLLTMLTFSRAPRVVEFDELPRATDVHTNIVAGFVSEDGRTVVACLPQAEAEAEAAFQMPDAFHDKEPASGKALEFAAGNSEIIVVRYDGAEFKARFVGLDGSTGLSFLEVAEPLLPPAPPIPHAPVLSEGQRIRLFAPEPLPPLNPDGPFGDAGSTDEVVYAQMGVVEARLTDILRAPSGKVVQAGVRAPGLSPAWAGSIAINIAGNLIGILSQNGAGGETRLIPAEVVQRAASRVLARRASVPKPWLGVRGDAVALTPLTSLLSKGWTEERAHSLLDNRRGVVLTSVAPGTPAALAGLRPGDVIARVSEREVKSVEDFSLLLKEAGGGTTLNFTVLRAEELSPLNLSVTLSGAQNPVNATKEAELRAAATRARMTLDHERMLEARARVAVAGAKGALEMARMAEAEARRSNDAGRLAEAHRAVVDAVKEWDAAEKFAGEASKRVEQASKAAAQAQAQMGEALKARGTYAKWRLIDGMDAVGMTSRLASRFRAEGGMLVVSVLPGSDAEAIGLKAGDVIETLDGQPLPWRDKAFDFKFDFTNNYNLNLGIVRAGQKITLTRPPAADAKEN